MIVAAVIVQLYSLPGCALLYCTGLVHVAQTDRAPNNNFTSLLFQIEMERTEGLVQRRRQPKVEENTEAGAEEIKQEAEAEKEPDMTVLELLKSSKLRVSLVICIVMHLR